MLRVIYILYAHKSMPFYVCLFLSVGSYMGEQLTLEWGVIGDDPQRNLSPQKRRLVTEHHLVGQRQPFPPTRDTVDEMLDIKAFWRANYVWKKVVGLFQFYVNRYMIF